MSLINCPDCQKEVSSRSTNCIHCGCPILSNSHNLPNSKLTSTTEDQVYFESIHENILISSKKIQIGSQVFNVNMINSYQTKKMPHPKSFYMTFQAIWLGLISMILIMLGIFGIMALLTELFNKEKIKLEESFYALLATMLFFVFGFTLRKLSNKYISKRDELQPSGMLTFVTSSGRSKVKITSYEDALKMAEAIDKAMK